MPGSVADVPCAGSGSVSAGPGSSGWLPGRAWFGGVLAEGVLERQDDPRVLDRGGWWAVVLTFEGDLRLYRFAQVRPAPLPEPVGPWLGPREGEWTSSLDADAYRAGVAVIRDRIRDGEVYQANLC